MLMVIFGAGASYDSSPDFPPSAGSEVIPSEPWRPPLTNELFLDTNGSFGDIVLRYPRLHGVLDFLRRPQKGRTVEQQLELYLEEASTDPERQRQLFSVRYYLHDLFRMVSNEWLKRTSGVTNYAILIDQIRHLNTSGEPVCLVSFNYDLLLDKVIFPGVNPPALERHFDAQPIFKLFKPHGSVDWARFAAGPEASQSPIRADATSGPRRMPDELIELGPRLTLSDQYVRANATDPHQMFTFNWCALHEATARKAPNGRNYTNHTRSGSREGPRGVPAHPRTVHSTDSSQRQEALQRSHSRLQPLRPGRASGLLLQGLKTSSRAHLEKHGCYVKGACDKCGRRLGPVTRGKVRRANGAQENTCATAWGCVPPFFSLIS